MPGSGGGWLGCRFVSRDMRYCHEIATRSFAASRDEHTLQDNPSYLVPVRGHPVPRPIPVPVPKPSGGAPRRSRRTHHRPGTGPGPTHRPRLDSALPSGGTSRPDAHLLRLWGRDPEIAGSPRASGSGPAPRPPQLGCGSEPLDRATPVPAPVLARRAQLAAVVGTGRARSRTGRAAAWGRELTGDAAP